MNTHEIKHMARVAEWKEKIAVCRSSGQTVRSWCEEEGISPKKYYYWERAVLAEAEKQLAVAESSRRPNFVEVPALDGQGVPEKKQTALAAKVRKGSMELEIYGGAEAETIELLLRALKNAE